MKERVDRVYSQGEEELDAILLMNDVEPNTDLSFFYVTGAGSGVFEGCLAVLWPDGGLDLLISQLEETSARRTDGQVQVFSKGQEREELVKELLGHGKRIGVNGSGLTYRNAMTVQKWLPEAELVDVHEWFESARMVKDQRELENLREAGRTASQVAEEIPLFLKEGMTEAEAAAEISYRMERRGASGPAFDTVAAFGAGSAEPHYSPGNVPLSRGDAALFDFGAAVRRYRSDITRTFFSREATERQERMYQVVRGAQEAALEEIRAGASSVAVDAAAREFIDSTEFQGRFIHSLGHGIGLSVHDGGRLGPNGDMELKENMVLTVEPGVYFPGEGGVRIEDDVRVTRDGHEMLTHATRDLMVI
ncbi:MAG: M24 family metallopeptidase [Methanomassiliicoccales archaeon]